MYTGFAKLKKKLASSGAKNPGAVAAEIGRKKYGAKAFEKHEHSGTSMKNVKPKAK